MSKKTILITGCSDGGSGSALAIAFHQAGWRVFATARNPGKMSSLTTAGIETLTLDVQAKESLSSCVAAVAKSTDGSLDALVNNAGVGLSMPVTDLSIEECKKMFDTNVWAPVLLTQAFLPMLMKARSGAMVVNNTSVAGVMGLPFQGAYNASKAAAIMLSDSMRLELAPFGIKVIDLRTGVVRTNFFANVKENDMSTKLPANSIFQIAREAVEKTMSGFFGGVHVTDRGQPAEVWAKNVVSDLSKRSPPAVIWRGEGASQIWLASCLPHRMLDGVAKKMSGVDKVEEAVKNQKESK